MEEVTIGYLNNKNKSECVGCAACEQVCPFGAITMEYDDEMFLYPNIDNEKCTTCGACHKACLFENTITRYESDKVAFGGYNIENEVRNLSTSGGAFSAIVDAWCDENYVIFGAESEGLCVKHSYVTNKKDFSKYRKSKYSQSIIGNAFKKAKEFLNEGKKVLFSGTPCQLAGLKTFLHNKEYENLLLVEVICEGVPSPLYVNKYDKYCKKKYGSNIKELDYRFTDGKPFSTPKRGKWDFEIMLTKLNNGKTLKRDRWFNPFWSIWLNHLMSRPCCYECKFANISRVADISLGDLWGVHLYCPELYGKNLGASLVVCNTQKGKEVMKKCEKMMFGHYLNFETSLKYQSPMRQCISKNPNREAFMSDLKSEMGYEKINKKWAKKISVRTWCSKYIFGNRQKIFLWSLNNKSKF